MKSNSRFRYASLLPCSFMIGMSPPVKAVDFAPMAGLRFGGDLTDTSDRTKSRSLTLDSAANYGGVVDVPLPGENGQRAVEFYFSRQRTSLHGGEILTPPVANLSVSVLHLGLVDTVVTDDPQLSWLLIGTAGATRLATQSGNDTRPSIGLGGAVRWMMSEHVGLRADLRALVNFTSGGGTALACNGGCNLYYTGTIVVQGEISIGLVLRF